MMLNHVNLVWILLILAMFTLVMSSQTKGNCKDKIITSQLHGQFSSPKYPKAYPNNCQCKWNISVPLGYHLMLNFTQFELEWGEKCEYDYVTVKSKNGTFGKFCGQRNEIKSLAAPRDPLFIYDSNIQVNFHTDFSNEVEVHGFEAHFAAIDMDECLFNNGGCNHFCHNFIGGYYCSCKIGYQLGPDKKTCIVKCSGIHLDQMSGIIESPEYPLDYPPEADCDWSIHTTNGYYINLQFIDFHIEDHHDSLCPFDKLEIQDEHSKKGPFCGKQPPAPYRSMSNWLIVEFKSDNSQQAKGFQAKYWLEPKKCIELIPPEFGVMTGPKNFTFKETLRFTCEPGFEYIDGTAERTCQADGTWTGKTGRCNQIICPFPRNRNYKTTIASNSNIIHHVNVTVKVICSLFYERIGSDTMVCQRNRTWSNTDTYCLKTCGMAFRRHPTIEKCSAGKHRTITRKNSQPWMVAIVEKKPGSSPKIICSGVLINQEWFITVANCVAFTKERHGQKGDLEIILGNFEWDKPHQETAIRRIKKIVFRRKYDYGLHSDIVLVQMDRPVKTDFIYVQPVCLPFGKKYRHIFNNVTNVATIGWYSNGDRHLTDRCVKVVDQATCQKYVQATHSNIQRDVWGSSNGRKHIVPTELMCTEATVGTNDRCKILAGSALVTFDPNKRKWYLGGILSWGHKDLNTCKKHMTSYDMFTKIDKHIKWIRMVTKVNLRYPDEKDLRASKRRKHS